MTEQLKKNKWVNVVLFFSLALNFFIAGYLVSDTKMLSPLHKNKMIHKRPEVRIVDYFPKAKKQEFRQLMMEKREKLKSVKRNIFGNQREILSILSAREVDEQQLRQVFRKYQDNNEQLQTAINEIVIKMLMEMDYESRRHTLRKGKKAFNHRKKMEEKWMEHSANRERLNQAGDR